MQSSALSNLYRLLCRRTWPVILVLATTSATAQELGYGGLGAMNHSLAGATAAMPLDGSGAMYWNPATLGVLDHGEAQLGFGRVNAPWHGDESISIPVLVTGIVILGLLDDEGSDEWWKGSRSHHHRDEEDDELSEAVAGKNWYPTVRGLNMSIVLPPDEDRRWNLGLGIHETGSRKNRILTDFATGKARYAGSYRVKTVEFTPTVSYRVGKRRQFGNMYLGITPLLSIVEFPEASLPQLPGYQRSAERNHAGFGLQLGVYLETKSKFNIGFSVRSPQWMSSSQVRWTDSGQNSLTRNLRYSTEHPMRYVLGVSYTGFERFKFAFDVRHYDFQHLSSLYGVTGRSVPKRATSYSLGIQFTPDAKKFPMSFRVGYQFSDTASLLEDFAYNMAGPISRGHSIHYGLSFGTPANKGFEMSFSLSHSFGDKTLRLGNRSFQSNPNDNAFWWSARWKF